MKLIYVSGEDFSASEFEQIHKPTLELWNKIKEGNEPFVIEDEQQGIYIELTALEFGDVDPAFIQFIYDKQDYDHQKNEQFYIVPEDGDK